MWDHLNLLYPFHLIPLLLLFSHVTSTVGICNPTFIQPLYIQVSLIEPRGLIYKINLILTNNEDCSRQQRQQ